MKLLVLLVLLLAGCGQIQSETEAVTEAETEVVVEEDEYSEVAETESEETEESEEEKTIKANEAEAYSALSGLPIEGENDSRVYGVMIDNHSQARPQSGLSKAAIVYEYEVESQITRYMALFSKEEVEKIGPVRSLRPYYLDSLAEYDGVIVRFGGSPQADEEVINFGIDEIDGMKNSTNIWRDSSTGKKAPHNAYTSSEAVLSGMEDYGYQSGETVGVFSFNKEFTELDEDSYEAENIVLPFNDYDTMAYEYDLDEENYIRSISGQVQKDEFYKDEIRPTNIIILFMEMGYMENGIHRWMGNIGQGEGIYISGGRARDINWSKDSRYDQTILTYEDGEEVLLNPGQTWVEMYNINKAYEIK